MSTPIGSSGNLPDGQSIRGGGEAPDRVSSQQFAQLMSVLAQEFGSYLAPDQAAVLMASIHQLTEAGLPAKEIADALYNSPGALDALKVGDTAKAAQLVASRLTESLSQLRESGVPEGRLRFLSESGFAAGEIAVALRDISGLRGELMQADAASAKQLVASLHEFFRGNGRLTHAEALVTASAASFVNADSAAGEWIAQYLNRIDAAQRRVSSLSRNAYRSEDGVPVPVFPAPVRDTPVDFGAWVVGITLAIAILILVVSHC